MTNLKAGWRNLWRNKSFSFINITGLAIGIAAALLLFIVVRYELSYDTFQKNYDNIYRVVTSDRFEDGLTYNAGIPVPALDALRVKFPQATFGSCMETICFTNGTLNHAMISASMPAMTNTHQ